MDPTNNNPTPSSLPGTDLGSDQPNPTTNTSPVAGGPNLQPISQNPLVSPSESQPVSPVAAAPVSPHDESTPADRRCSHEHYPPQRPESQQEKWKSQSTKLTFSSSHYSFSKHDAKLLLFSDSRNPKEWVILSVMVLICCQKTDNCLIKENRRLFYCIYNKRPPHPCGGFFFHPGPSPLDSRPLTLDSRPLTLDPCPTYNGRFL